MLLPIDQEIKQIILAEGPIRTGEEIYFSLGTVSFNYKLKSDLENFDEILLANSLIDVIISQDKESLDPEHMQILLVCCQNRENLEASALLDSWLKVFQKLKEYLLVSICDSEICSDSIMVLHNFLTADQLKYNVYTETKDLFVKSLELLYNGEATVCKENFRNYLLEKVVTRT